MCWRLSRRRALFTGVKESPGDIDARRRRGESCLPVLDASILLRSSICALPDIRTPSTLLTVQNSTIVMGLSYHHLGVGNGQG